MLPGTSDIYFLWFGWTEGRRALIDDPHRFDGVKVNSSGAALDDASAGVLWLPASRLLRHPELSG